MSVENTMTKCKKQIDNHKISNGIISVYLTFSKESKISQRIK